MFIPSSAPSDTFLGRSSTTSSSSTDYPPPLIVPGLRPVTSYLFGRCRSESALSSIQSHKALYLFPVTCLSKGTYCPLLLDSEMVRLEHFVLLFAVLALCSATRTSYDGFQVIRVPTGEDSQAVDGIISQFNLDTWRYTWSSADVLIPPHHIAAFTEKMQEAGLNTTILDQDVGASIAAEGPIAATSK